MVDLILTRAIHVLFVIHWIGGLAFVTLVVLPLGYDRRRAAETLALFEVVERRFSTQVRVSVPIAGAAGLWMTWRMQVWDRFLDPAYWWMGAMLGLWLLFMLMLFVVEPLMRRGFHASAAADPAAILRRLTVVHGILLTLAILTVLGAMAGAHGFNFT